MLGSLGKLFKEEEPEGIRSLLMSHEFIRIAEIHQSGIYTEQQWNDMLQLYGYCPHCYAELETDSYKEQHGDCNEPWLTETICYYVCPRGCVLED